MRKILIILFAAVTAIAALHGGNTAKLSDDQFLDMVSRACFEFFWKEVSPESGITKDNSKFSGLYSSAATGFGLSAMIVGAERGYRPRKEIEARVNKMLDALDRSKRKNGMFYHFLSDNGQPSIEGYEIVASTIDSGLMLMGIITVGEYFGGAIKAKADKIVAAVNWKSMTDLKKKAVYMAWQPKDKHHLDGEGHFHKAWWNLYSDEAVICTLLAVSAPKPEYRIPAEYFYHWERALKKYTPLTPGYKPTEKFVVSWTGALFTYQFAHLWIDFAKLGKDTPEKFGLKKVPAINWFNNSYQASMAAWMFSIDRRHVSKSFNKNSWGMTACASESGYYVGGFLPRAWMDPLRLEGTIAPYGAGTSIMFTPKQSIAALRYYYNLKGKNSEKLVWRDIKDGAYGFLDSFNLDSGFVADEYIGIDQGPLLLAIENYRTGLIRKYFMKNKHIREGLKRIGFNNLNTSKLINYNQEKDKND